MSTLAHHFQQLLDAMKLRGLLAMVVTMQQAITGSAPDRRRALRSYSGMAEGYEVRTFSGDQWRRELVEQLAPRPGEIILDVGCGTARNFDQIMHHIGPRGRLIGIEPSPEMLARAQALVERRGWLNVDLVLAGAEEAAIPMTADAAILCAVHDVMRSPAALANVVAHVREHGRIVAGGAKWASWRRVRFNLATWRLNRDCVSTFEGFRKPWSRLARLVPELRVQEVLDGAGYVATATLRSPAGGAR